MASYERLRCPPELSVAASAIALTVARPPGLCGRRLLTATGAADAQIEGESATATMNILRWVSIESERIATHRQEAFELRSVALDQLRRIDQMLTVGAAFIAAITGVAIAHREAMLGVPSAALLITVFVTQAYTDLIVTSSARRAAETALERELGPLATFYGRLAEPYRSGGYIRSVAAIGVIVSLVELGAIAGGGIIAGRTHLHHDLTGGHTVLIAYIVVTTLFCVAAAMAYVDLARASRGTRAAYAQIMTSLGSPSA
jgi:hypothetical protein